jgi:predicted ArsR family transcriptional regulator
MPSGEKHPPLKRSKFSWTLTNNSRTPPSYDEVASRLQVTTGAVKTHIHRLRKRDTALLREEVGRTVSDPAEIDEEIHALCEL